MTDITKISARKLEALYTKRQAACSVNCTAFINAGRGWERPSEIRTKTDPLSLEYVACADAVLLVIDEMAARKAWGGTLNPIKRRAS